MFRKENGRDVTDEELETIINPFLEKCDSYLEKILIPDYIAFYIATGFRTNSIWEASFDVLIHTAINSFNIASYSNEKMKQAVTNILYERYMLNVIKDIPLELGEIEYDKN